MPSRKHTLVALCQQSLALGAVLAVLTPAASIVSIDIVSEAPHHSGSPATGTLSMESARVPLAPVDPKVREISLTPAKGASTLGRSRAGLAATLRRTPTGERMVSTPERVTGLGTVGVTWAHGEGDARRSLTFSIRTQTHGVWSAWQPLEFDDAHAPDAGSTEAAKARPGTDALVVGAVDNVQVRATSTGVVPDDMKLAVIDPGTPKQSAVEAPAIDTNKLPSAVSTAVNGWASSGESLGATTPRQVVTPSAGSGAVALQSINVTAKPVIFSRAQWGADERMRQASSLHYGEVHAGFIHHTVNANDYSAADVPSILRGIYAYHTQSRGWSDIGYNYLVDRFGRIWEGRYGGIDRDPVGAHTLGYNDWSFGASAIGNYQTAQPSAAMLEAYAKLFAWKLGLAGVSASSTRQWVGTHWFQAINGHRDAGQTLCPGQYLYAKIPWIRQRAAQLQAAWGWRQLQTNLTGSPASDLVVRRASDGRGFVLPMDAAGLGFAAPSVVGAGLASRKVLVVSPDLTGDGRPDLLVGPRPGFVAIRPGLPNGTFGANSHKTTIFAGTDLITAAGDLNHDGNNDFIARLPRSGRLAVFLGNGDGGFAREVHRKGWSSYNLLVGAGDLNGDGFSDLISRDTSGALSVLLGSGRGGVSRKIAVPGSWSGYDAITAGDFTGDGVTDILARGASSQVGYVFKGLGGGSFAAGSTTVPGVGGIKNLQAASLVGAPAADLVGTNASDLVVLANGTAGRGYGTAVDTGQSFAGARQLFNVGDWDRDGSNDVAALVGGSLMLYRGDGTGRLAAPVRISTAFSGVSLVAAVGDFTGDGYPDLTGRTSAGTMMIFPGNGLAGVRAAYPAYSLIQASRQVGVGLWDGDGAPDSLFRFGNQLRLYRGDGPGGFTSSTVTYSPSVAPYDWIIGVPDMTGDGHPDLLVRVRGTGQLGLLTGSLTSGFTGPAKLVGRGMLKYDLAD